MGYDRAIDTRHTSGLALSGMLCVFGVSGRALIQDRVMVGWDCRAATTSGLASADDIIQGGPHPFGEGKGISEIVQLLKVSAAKASKIKRG